MRSKLSRALALQLCSSSNSAAALWRRRGGMKDPSSGRTAAAEQASETLRANKTKEGGEGTWAPSLLLLQFCLLLPFFCALPYLPLTYTLSNTVYYVLSFLSARLAGSSAGSTACRLGRLAVWEEAAAAGKQKMENSFRPERNHR